MDSKSQLYLAQPAQQLIFFLSTRVHTHWPIPAASTRTAANASLQSQTLIAPSLHLHLSAAPNPAQPSTVTRPIRFNLKVHLTAAPASYYKPRLPRRRRPPHSSTSSSSARFAHHTICSNLSTSPTRRSFRPLQTHSHRPTQSLAPPAQPQAYSITFPYPTTTTNNNTTEFPARHEAPPPARVPHLPRRRLPDRSRPPRLELR
ncbi:hypothetical protein BDV95DRAFT_63402 [Massariosphaeria phaeospora]|uniref:Uncharacterized protein n=1 Tax=Massariosphaeria phaeospora TaxID=100035 RepID=A0A7C8M8U0_9PLEO|nr:hypothetical protein BDV95DRAFT_63402 [Massariosphaeria phaeospora]